MLKVIMGLGNNTAEAITVATNEYNKPHEDGYRMLAQTQVFTQDNKSYCLIWYTLREDTTPVKVEEFEYIGSKGINPADPNWRNVWDSLQSDDTLVDTPVTSPEVT